jgi:seryl-tRNA synthetase
MAALLENGQQSDGSIKLPVALAPYMGTDLILSGHNETSDLGKK